MLTPETALGYWYRAAESKVGIAISTPHRDWLKTILWAARKLAKDADLDDLMVVSPPNKDELWICRKEVTP